MLLMPLLEQKMRTAVGTFPRVQPKKRRQRQLQESVPLSSAQPVMTASGTQHPASMCLFLF
jgi:hypothetical protein